MLSLLVFVSLLGAALPQDRSGRLRPPETITCDRNKLTSFSGAVTQWSRNDSGARLNMNTDADTREVFNIRFEKGIPPERSFLLGGRIFRAEDWAKVETSAGRLRAGIQATVWVCEGNTNPIVDWRLPPD